MIACKVLGKEDEVCGGGDIVTQKSRKTQKIKCLMDEGRCKMLLSAIWLFCSYLFVPQWGRKHKGQDV